MADMRTGKKLSRARDRSPVRDEPLYSPNPDGLKNYSLLGACSGHCLVRPLTVGGIATLVLSTDDRAWRANRRRPGPWSGEKQTLPEQAVCRRIAFFGNDSFKWPLRPMVNPRIGRSGTTRRRFLGRSRRGMRASCHSESGDSGTNRPQGRASTGSKEGVLPMISGVRRLSWRLVPSCRLASRPARAQHSATKPVLESLEGRQLLALFTGFSHMRNILTSSGVYSLQINGPGVLREDASGRRRFVRCESAGDDG